jgi:hypothetical protein
MKQIHIIRVSSTEVKFEPVSVDNTETVFFTNMDPDQPHKPSILHLVGDEVLGPYPPIVNSSQCPVPPPAAGTTEVPYGCDLHADETGVINVYPQLAAVNLALTATKGQAINSPVVVGGMPPYTITDLIVNNVNVPGSSTGPHERLTIGIGLQLVQNEDGFISVFGTPREVETYNFTFTVNDSMGRNLQQVQYSLTVSVLA